MNIWVDADSCPAPVKEILYRVAVRTQTTVTLVANRLLAIPSSPYVKAMKVAKGFDVADDRIASLTLPGDLIVTADIPLAAKAIEQGGFALNPRGTFYSAENVREYLGLRNFMEEMRSSGMEPFQEGAAPFRHADRMAFANQLDRFLATRLTVS